MQVLCSQPQAHSMCPIQQLLNHFILPDSAETLLDRNKVDASRRVTRMVVTVSPTPRTWVIAQAVPMPC